MKEYLKPELLIILINEKDIITQSGNDMEIDVGDFEDIFNITYANFKEVKENNGDTPDYQKV